MTTIKNLKHPYFHISIFPYFPYTPIPLLPLIVLIFLFSFSESTHSQILDSTNYPDESNKIFKPNIKTVLFHRDGWDMSPPIIKLNSDEKLKLSFDDLDADAKIFTYSIRHCNSGWQPSLLEPGEYMEGYEDENIEEYQFSLNTLVPYTHYELLFPTEDMRPLLSGNYILKVYLDHPDSVYFTRRFYIVESKVMIEGQVKQASVIEDRKYKQEVDFYISSSGYRIANPYQDIKVILMQNGRQDNIITDLKPRMVVNDRIDFDYDRENVFAGGNEFRSFDTKSLKYNTEFVASIKNSNTGYDIYLRDGEKRSFQVYKTEQDINGQYKIKTEDGDVSEIEAEYVNVHFFLPYPAPMIDGEFFIIGQLTDWQFNEESRMNYNFKRKGYEKSFLLKQGYYNYLYILRYNDQLAGDESFFEGTHSETENSYTLLIYHRDISKDYDKLVGIKFLNSSQEK
jgi:hypothetical protein